MKLGFHVSISGSIDRSFDRATELGCSAFQIFTRNPRTWRSKELTTEEVRTFRCKHRSSGIGFVVSHMPYLPNLASPNETIYKKSVDSLIEETERCRELGIRYIVTHVGNHVGAGVEKGRTQLIEALGKAVDEGGLMILLENASSSGNHLGSKFSDLSDIADAVGGTRIGFCLDTCHAFAAGYNLTTEDGLKKTLHKIRETICFNKLKLVHLNDSVGVLASGVDHHDHIGLGHIGEEGFRRILASQLAKRPMIMEVPMDERRGGTENMAKVRELSKR
ncbi:TPA: deoxyribonuclease IV [Candidatus Bathyarchaeota archaeon]|nr:deoxyribonuclease IV [Candidatus Bathyarchaeota archaeon]